MTYDEEDYRLATMRLKSTNEQLEARKDYLERQRDRLTAEIAVARAEIAAIKTSQANKFQRDHQAMIYPSKALPVAVLIDLLNRLPPDHRVKMIGLGDLAVYDAEDKLVGLIDFLSGSFDEVKSDHQGKIETTAEARDVTTTWDGGYETHEPRKIET